MYYGAMTSTSTPGAEEETPDLLYFSSASENTHRFIQRLERPALRIPLRPRLEGMIRVNAPYVLLLPSYGGGALNGPYPSR